MEKNTFQLICEANVTPITNPAKKSFNFKPMSFMNTDTKILNRILANRIQQYKKQNES